VTQEVKLVGETERLNYVAGVFFLDEKSKTSQIDYFGVLLSDWILTTPPSPVAVYGQADVELTDQLTLTLGARYTTEDKTLAYLDAVKANYPAGVVRAFPPANQRPSTENVRARGVRVAGRGAAHRASRSPTKSTMTGWSTPRSPTASNPAAGTRG
jgi:iron complex outermembrane receptor protein